MLQYDDEILKEDVVRISGAAFIPWDRLRGKTILVTGATGLIGYNLIHALVYVNTVKELGMTLLALVRDEKKAEERFGDFLSATSAMELIVGSVECLPEITRHIDYIVHGASQTSSKSFVDAPVETIMTALNGTVSLLKLARSKHISGMVYLSSMEVYGHPERGHKVRESDACALSSLDVRNSYPISKLQCESLCHCYASEYGVPVTIARLTQTFGAGVSPKDGRIFAYFGKCVKEKRDIVLKTKGETERSYLYTADAVTAILTLLLKGESGEAYNIADEETYCSIAQMAERLAAEHGIRVRYKLEDERANGYPTALYMDLDTSKLRTLGWEVMPGNNMRGGVNWMYHRMIRA